MMIFRYLTTVLASLLLFCVANAQELKNSNGYVHLFQVNSNMTKASEKYIYENDTIKLTYYFWGNRGIMQISIFNKTNAPIYINWEKSFMKNNLSEKLVYAYEKDLSAQTVKLYKSYVHEGRNLSSIDYEGNYQMGIVEEKKVETTTEIKAKGFYMSLRFNIIPGEIYRFEEGTNKVSEARNDDNRAVTDVYYVEFNEQQSPLRFSSTVVYSMSKDLTNEKSLENSFWVSKIREMDAKHFMGEKSGKTPEGFPIYKFPFRKSTSFYIEVDKKNSIIYKVSKSSK